MTSMPRFEAGGATFHYAALGVPPGEGTTHLVWAHGWGQDHRAFLALAAQMERAGAHTLLDFPGFGASPRPPADWGTEDYADAVAGWLATLPRGRRIWIGHSFGCRVGLQLAARHPGLVDGLFLVAAAGLRRHRSPAQRLRMTARVTAYKLLGRLAALGLPVEGWRSRFGSADYRAAGAMRPILVKVVREDLSAVAARVTCPVQLVYGSDDDDTPPELGHRFVDLIPGARLAVLDGFDHHTILGEGRHQLLFRLNQFLKAAP
ncbi:alpha/beta fold hydrolase [Azospirillum halopraeferens]|uniref:alpha/beta fold hydrolase n=1 Tax=Azospirillum halopraeferens TaxID=34010 RepID=UPI00041AE5CD|nr:alpha/beta hydrolase [Azospirillum halopraeferens]